MLRNMTPKLRPFLRPLTRWPWILQSTGECFYNPFYLYTDLVIDSHLPAALLVNIMPSPNLSTLPLKAI